MNGDNTDLIDDYLRDLHDAERSFQEGGPGAFDRKSLLDVLNAFCQTIADRCKAESCTIQLKVHDPSTVPAGEFENWIAPLLPVAASKGAKLHVQEQNRKAVARRKA